MYQIKVNGVLMPTIYYTLREAMDACAAEKARGCAVVTEIVVYCPKFHGSKKMRDKTRFRCKLS